MLLCWTKYPRHLPNEYEMNEYLYSVPNTRYENMLLNNVDAMFLLYSRVITMFFFFLLELEILFIWIISRYCVKYTIILLIFSTNAYYKLILNEKGGSQSWVWVRNWNSSVRSYLFLPITKRSFFKIILVVMAKPSLI